jgi:hypothetical protein
VKEPLSKTHKKIASEANGWNPSEFTSGSKRKLEWRCSKGHTYLAQIVSRTLHGSGCPYCSGRLPIVGLNDLSTTHPEISKEANGWDPQTVKAGSHKSVEWKCSKGHIYAAQVDNRAIRNSNCPYCSGRKAILGVNDIASLNKELSAQAFGWDPSKVKISSGLKYLWRCQNNHIWQATAASRTRGTGCPVCANRSVQTGFNDLATTHPAIAKEAFGWDPKFIVAGKVTKKHWKCSFGHKWFASVNSRTSQGVGCPFCSGNKLLSGFNDFKKLYPETAREAHGWDPSKFVYGSNLKKKWKCSEGHIWEAVIKSRAAGRGCPTCAPYGFDPNKSAYLYLIEHKSKKLIKIGISNSSTDRTKQHESRGWNLVEIFGPMPGKKAFKFEQECLDLVIKNGAKMASPIEHGRFDGYTESWVSSSFPLKSIKALLRDIGLISK